MDPNTNLIMARWEFMLHQNFGNIKKHEKHTVSRKVTSILENKKGCKLVINLYHKSKS